MDRAIGSARSDSARAQSYLHVTQPGRLFDQLFELCDRLEAAERYGDGDRDVP